MRAKLAFAGLFIIGGLWPSFAQQGGGGSQSENEALNGTAAYGDWTTDRPGLRRKITPADLPAPYATRSTANGPSVVRAPQGAKPKVPAGFTVEPFVTGLSGPRLMRVAPNGDIFVAETYAGRVRVIRAADGAAKPEKVEVFAQGLDEPFGIAFYPPGPDPKWVYEADTNAVLRFPYTNGDLAAGGEPEVMVKSLPTGGHTTRDVIFSADGSKMYVSVGSASNDADNLRGEAAEEKTFIANHPLGATWGREENRADVLVFDPQGRSGHIFATGLRNCVGLAIHPQTKELWCSTNERDGFGDDLPPDYVTRVKEGSFFGWPWYYIGAHPDPRHKGEREDLAEKVSVPDVLLQPHSAPLAMSFYQPASGAPAAFPKDYDGDAFVALHGSWNRSKRTGYKVVRIKLSDGVPTGEYQDFLTGFVTGDGNVWGRPVGVAV
ncbi:MAG: PQQ-dependent sugar dehydrogenase, partial [Hyphomicrobiales bacterium]|nr:PQQ-dependent sugar dehydrogenase [Hyphomicrobiales bacterium]